MRSVVNRFGSNVTIYLVVEGLALGRVYNRAVGVTRYRIHARTAGGHSWSDHGRPSAVHELAALITRLTNISLPREPRATLNVGTMRGGTGVNVLAAEAVCEMDLRSEGALTLKKLTEQIEVLVRNANREDVNVSAELIGHRPSGEMSTDHPIIKLGLCERTGLGA
jgi:tripeptide aminopeptidase